MSDLHTPPPSVAPPPPPFAPAPAGGWRDHLASITGALDMSLARLLGGAALLAVVAVIGWRLLAPPPAPAEMQLPTADRAALTGDAAPPPAAAHPAGAPGGDQPEGGEVVVHVVGAVARPGVQHLPSGSRIEDAVDAAGGTKPDADLSRLNLAAVLDDGEQIYVVRVGEQPPVAVVGTPAPGAGGPGAPPGPPVDLNRASEAELDTLPGVGPATAAAIVATRQERGGFRSVDDLLDVRGIGEAKLAQLRDRVTV